MTRLLILDDEAASCKALSRLLTLDGYDVTWATTRADAIAVGKAIEPDILICDQILNEGLDGVEVARSLLGLWPKMRIIFFSGVPAHEIRGQTFDLPVIAILEKPLGLIKLPKLVRQCFEAEAREADYGT